MFNKDGEAKDTDGEDPRKQDHEIVNAIRGMGWDGTADDDKGCCGQEDDIASEGVIINLNGFALLEVGKEERCCIGHSESMRDAHVVNMCAEVKYPGLKQCYSVEADESGAENIGVDVDCPVCCFEIGPRYFH